MIASYGARLQRLLAGVLGDVARAEDVGQDTWFAVWSDRERLDDGDPWPWIRAVGLRKAIDRLRHDERRRTASADVEDAAAPALADHGADEHLASLPRDERAALVLYFWEGLSVAEIAVTLGAPVGTIKTWMHRGRARLRERLGRERGR